MANQQRHDELQQMEFRFIRKDLHIVASIMAAILGIIAFLYFYDQKTGFISTISQKLFENIIR